MIGYIVETFGMVETVLGSTLGITLCGWVYQAYRSACREKDLRLKTAEDKITLMDKADTKLDETLKRVHYRIDEIEKSQNKLETKIESDIREVKHSIDKLTSLVIKAMQHTHHHTHTDGDG